MNKQEPPYPMALSEDGRTVKIEFGGTVELTAAQLDELITWLGHFRSRAAPAISKDYRQAPHFLFADEIQIVPIPPDGSRPATEAGANLLFQSPMFGWFQHPAKPEFCQRLLDFLLSQGSTPPPGTQKH
jgi:hypothetical protein